MWSFHRVLVEELTLSYQSLINSDNVLNVVNLVYIDTAIERRGRVVFIPASYSGGPGFKFWPGDRLSWLRFVVGFLSDCDSENT
jgi:hypothetical protein